MFVAIWLASTIYLALALAICVVVLLVVYWAFTQLPARFGGERPDKPQDPR